MTKDLDEAILQLEARSRVFQAVAGEPGIHLSEVARRTGLRVTHARYHLHQLSHAGLVSPDPQGGFVRYYPRMARAGLRRDIVDRNDKAVLDALRRRQALHVVLLLLNGPLGLGEIAARMGKSRPTALFHLERLAAPGIVERLGDSQATRRFGLREPAQVLRLLARFPPPRSLVSSFVDLWDGLALPGPSQPGLPGPSEADAPAGAPAPGPAGTAPGGRLAALLRWAAWRPWAWMGRLHRA